MRSQLINWDPNMLVTQYLQSQEKQAPQQLEVLKHNIKSPFFDKKGTTFEYFLIKNYKKLKFKNTKTLYLGQW